MEHSTFTGMSRTSQKEAIDQATRPFYAWYQQQKVRYTTSGGSVFQFSASAFVDPRGFFVYIITVFDIRQDLSS